MKSYYDYQIYLHRHIFVILTGNHKHFVILGYVKDEDLVIACVDSYTSGKPVKYLNSLVYKFN